MGYISKSDMQLLVDNFFVSGDAGNEADAETPMLVMILSYKCHEAGNDGDVIPIIYIGHLLKSDV